MSGENNIPKHWGRTKASEVGKLLRGVNYKKEEASSEAKKDYLPVLRGNNINGELNFDDLVYVQTKNISQEQLIKSGDIVFAMSSGSKHLVGKSAKAKTNFNGSFGAFCGVFRPNENFNKDFVAYFFQSPYYKKVISEISKGTNINNLKREHILDLDFPIPPLTEQQAIVAKIEALLSELDNGKQQLQTAQQQLKVYRQSLLKWAFEGKLTNGKFIKTVSLGSVIEKPKYGTSKKCDYTTNGIGVLRIPNIANGFIDTTDLKFAKFSKEELETYSLNTGDLLIIRSNGSVDLVGKCALVKEKETKFLFAGYLIRLRPLKEIINPVFLQYILSSHNLRIQIESKAKSTSGVNNINTEEIKSLQIPLPPMQEQQLIVSELESKLTVCDKIEETISQSLQQAETLRQSILKKAFEGKLVNTAPITSQKKE